MLDQQYIDGVLVSIEKFNQDGSGAVSKKKVNGQFNGMQTFFLKMEPVIKFYMKMEIKLNIQIQGM